MIKSIVFIAAMMMTSVSVVYAVSNNQATSIGVNPGEDPVAANDSADRVEGGVNLTGIEKDCPACKAHAAEVKRLAENTNPPGPSYDLLKPRPVNDGLVPGPGKPNGGGR